MAIDGVGGTSNLYSNSNTSGARIADNFNQFLQLLTTQLRNQNPLDPLDTNQFTQQLVQFAGVEQQIQTNDTLGSLLAADDTSRLAGAVNFIGERVVAEGATTVLDEQSAVWHINAKKDAPNSVVVVSDAEGNEIYAQEVQLTEGDQVFAWNGTDNDGTPQADGFYTIKVVARDATGAAVVATTDIQGKVTGIELEDNQPVLKIGNTIRVKLSSVKSVVGETEVPAGT